MQNKDIVRFVNKLKSYLDAGDIPAFADTLQKSASLLLLSEIRTQKVLARGNEKTRSIASELVVQQARNLLEEEPLSEFIRYVALGLAISRARQRINIELDQQRRDFSKLSKRELIHVAERTFIDIYDRAKSTFPSHDPKESVSENERRLHALSAHTNDIAYAVIRALNETSRAASDRDLRRPDMVKRSIKSFVKVTQLSSSLNSIEYILDSASFGDFRVSAIDFETQNFMLDFVDLRLVLIRQLSIRRTLTKLATGHRQPRWTRDRLEESYKSILYDALSEYLQTPGTRIPSLAETNELEYSSRALLRTVDAEDDLLCFAAGDTIRPAMLYHLSLALRMHALTATHISSKLSNQTRKKFDKSVRLKAIVKGLTQSSDREAAKVAWGDLTVQLPARTHFELLRRPFARTAPGVALPVFETDLGTWTTVVRETLIRGGEIGRRYGAIWEDIFARSFEQTGWSIIGRNINIVANGSAITEVDLLLLREDLLLVVEVKAMIGSKISPYDHWKNKIIIQKGCRQARLSAQHLSNNRDFIASIANRAIAAKIRYFQPLVLTNEDTFDGWEYAGVPVAGEATREAITVGSKVEYFDAANFEVVHVDHHLRVEELSTETILTALRDPIELRLAPEQGAVKHVAVCVDGLTFLVPDPAVGSDTAPG